MRALSSRKGSYCFHLSALYIFTAHRNRIRLYYDRQSYLFLRVKKTEPAKAYYHLVVPNEDFNIIGYLPLLSAKCCVFLFLAFESRPRDQKWLRDEQTACVKWNVDEEYVLSRMSPARETHGPEEPNYESSTESSTEAKSNVNSSYGTRSKSSRNDTSLNTKSNDGPLNRSTNRTQTPSCYIPTRSKTLARTSGGREAGARQGPA